MIDYIMKNKPKDLEIEMFIHGAICFAYSGRCYLSQYLSDRGANCGDCSQPCRWQYRVSAEEVNTPGSVINLDYDERGTYIFNSKDLCMIEHIPELMDAGIDSFKVEGRTKSLYYVSAVAKAYREAIDKVYTNPNADMQPYFEELLK